MSAYKGSALKSSKNNGTIRALVLTVLAGIAIALSI